MTALWHTGFFKRPLVRRSFNNDVVRFSEMFCHEGLAKSRQEILSADVLLKTGLGLLPGFV